MITTTVNITSLQPELRSGFIVLVFIAFDVLFGLLQAVINQNFESCKMRTGLGHKIGEILCYLFGAVCSEALPLIDINIPFPLSGAITVYIVVMEIGSILENMSKISPVMAKYIGFLFERLQPDETIPDPGLSEGEQQEDEQHGQHEEQTTER